MSDHDINDTTIQEGEAAKAQLQAMQAQAQGAASEPAVPTGDAPTAEPGSGQPQEEVDPNSLDLVGDPDTEVVEAGMDDEIDEQIVKHQKFTDHFKKKLKEKGLGPDAIRALETGALANRTETIRDFIANAGGQEFPQVQEWAKSGALTKEEQAGYQAAAQSKDQFMRQAAARDLLTRYRAAGGVTPTNHLDGHAASRQQQGYSFEGPSDMLSVLNNDPRMNSGGRVGQQYNQHKQAAAAGLADQLGIDVIVRKPRK